jgi:uncharacterized protein with HEPN domain
VISEATWILLEDMLAHAREAVEFLADCDAHALEADRMRRSAVIREAEVVGEAAFKVSPEQRKLFPAIPWRQAATIRTDFPPLIAELERILQSDPQGKP